MLTPPDARGQIEQQLNRADIRALRILFHRRKRRAFHARTPGRSNIKTNIIRMKPSQSRRLFGTGLATTLAISASASIAATLANPASNDIFLGFRASGGTGASTSYLVNLGQYSQFSGATPGATLSLNGIGDIGTDLAATFGANWNTRQDLFWGVFGVGGSGSATVYASREQSTPGTPADAWPLLDSTTRASTYSQITSVINNIGGYRGSTSTPNTYQ